MPGTLLGTSCDRLLYVYMCVYACIYVCAQLLQLCPALCDPMDCSLPSSCPWDSLGMNWSGLPCPPPGDLPDPGIKPASPALQDDSLLLSNWESPCISICICIYFCK